MIKFYKEAATDNWVCGVKRKIAAGTCTMEANADNSYIEIKENGVDKTIAEGPVSSFVTEAGVAYASFAELEAATADFFVNATHPLEVRVAALESKQTLFIDHWTLPYNGVEDDIIGNKRNNDGVIEEYYEELLDSMWLPVVIQEGDVWFDSEAPDLSVYNNAAWAIIPLSSESVYINRANNISYVWTGSMMTPASSVLSFATEQEARDGISTDDVISPFTLASATKELKTLTTIGGQLTGFSNPLDCIVTYNPADRNITLTGDVSAFWQGRPMIDLVPSFVSGWTSAAHSDADGSYFLYFNGTSFVWDTVAWDFKQLMIAMAYRDGSNFCLRECHGLQDWQSHEANHNNIGTVLRSGADLEPNSYTALSTTATNRRPKITSALVYDEDLPSLLAALNTADVTASGYTRMFMSGAATANIEVGQADIIEYATRFQYNLFTGGVWTKATAANNDYAKIFLMAIPTTADADCAKRRFVWIMPQQVGTLAVVDALTPNNINLGQIAGALAEYVFVQEFVIQATATSWQIVKNAKLTGNKRFQSSTTGNYLSAVATNTTLTGNGTPSSPLGIPYRTVVLADGTIDMTANPAEIYTRTASASQQFTILNPVIGKVFYLHITGGTLNADLFASPMVETWILNALVTDYVPASTNILACQITSATTMKIFWTE